jgi:predicted small lipoprotein YifL
MTYLRQNFRRYFWEVTRMSRKLTAVVVIAALIVAGAGCRKKPAQAPPPKTEVKSQAEYDSQAKKDINSENMQAELDRIEKDVRQERSGGF